MPREAKEHVPLRRRIPEARAVSVCGGQGRGRGDGGHWWVAKIWIIAGLACLIKAPGCRFEELVNGLKAAGDIRINSPSCFPTAIGLTFIQLLGSIVSRHCGLHVASSPICLPGQPWECFITPVNRCVYSRHECFVGV